MQPVSLNGAPGGRYSGVIAMLLVPRPGHEHIFEVRYSQWLDGTDETIEKGILHIDYIIIVLL